MRKAWHCAETTVIQPARAQGTTLKTPGCSFLCTGIHQLVPSQKHFYHCQQWNANHFTSVHVWQWILGFLTSAPTLYRVCWEITLNIPPYLQMKFLCLVLLCNSEPTLETWQWIQEKSCGSATLGWSSNIHLQEGLVLASLSGPLQTSLHQQCECNVLYKHYFHFFRHLSIKGYPNILIIRQKLTSVHKNSTGRDREFHLFLFNRSSGVDLYIYFERNIPHTRSSFVLRHNFHKVAQDWLEVLINKTDRPKETKPSLQLQDIYHLNQNFMFKQKVGTNIPCKKLKLFVFMWKLHYFHLPFSDCCPRRLWTHSWLCGCFKNKQRRKQNEQVCCNKAFLFAAKGYYFLRSMYVLSQMAILSANFLLLVFHQFAWWIHRRQENRAENSLQEWANWSHRGHCCLDRQQLPKIQTPGQNQQLM